MIELSFTMSDVFGDGHVFVPAASFETPGWLPTDRAVLDSLTGGQLVLAGDFPVVCHEAVSTPAVLDLLAEAGHARPRRLLRYADAPSLRRRLDELEAGDDRVVLQHVHPPGAVSPERLWIAEDVLRFVNNKGRLDRLVPEGHAPLRDVLEPARLSPAEASKLEPPVVLKAADDVSSGGGWGVRVCRTRAELEQAWAFVGSAPEVVVEEWVAFELTWCVQLVVRPDGAVRYVGSAEQICDASGTYRGNWVVADAMVPDEVVALGEEVTRRVAALGYRGFLGIDIGLARDGRILAFDVNGRYNGSSVALSVFDSLAERGVRAVRSGGWAGTGDFEHLLRVVRDAMAAGTFVPFAVYDPRAGDPSAPPRVNGAIVGRSIEEAIQHEKELAAAGLH